MEWNILFMGPVGAGKTQAIRSISDIEVVDTDQLATDGTRALKARTTVAMDVGTLELGGQDKLRLSGAPGQDRFDFMWDILLAQSKGVVLVLNHGSADPAADLDHFLRAIDLRVPGRRLPMVIGVTHTDERPERRLDVYHELLRQRLRPDTDLLPPVLAMDARNRKHVHAVLVAMAAQLEMAERFPRVSACVAH